MSEGVVRATPTGDTPTQGDVTATEPGGTPVAAVVTRPIRCSAFCDASRGVLAVFLRGRTGMMET